jgi:hypothetical protein
VSKPIAGQPGKPVADLAVRQGLEMLLGGRQLVGEAEDGGQVDLIGNSATMPRRACQAGGSWVW